MKRLVLAAFLASTLAAILPAIEAKEGLVKLVVSETGARISLYRLVDIAKGRYEPLLFDQDPRTTFATLSVDGRQVKLGDASDYRSSVSRTDSGVRIEFRSSFCVVRQIVDFAKTEGAALADGVRVTFELENVSQKDSQLGLRYLLDTWLAEKSGLHFSTDRRSRVSEETAILPSAQDAWLSTAGDKANFMVMLGGPAAERPDRVLLANWKRLSDAAWGFDANPQRNFTLVPYSINDSAVALFWEPAAVPRGGQRRISFVMGAFSEKGYPASSEAKSKTEEIFAATVLGAPAADAATSMAGDLVAVRDLISRIDRAIAGGGSISDEEIAAWKKILDRLEEKMKGY